jgi:hypothetical protein
MIPINHSSCCIFNVVLFYHRNELIMPTLHASQTGKPGHNIVVEDWGLFHVASLSQLCLGGQGIPGFKG